MDPFEDENRRGGQKGGGKLPGAASLHEQLDKEIVVCLRDGRNFKGCLRSFDQYANLVLDRTVERLMVDGTYAEVPLGIFVVRGENVMLLGETDARREAEFAQRFRRLPEIEVRRAIAKQIEDRGSLERKERLAWPIPEDFET